MVKRATKFSTLGPTGEKKIDRKISSDIKKTMLTGTKGWKLHVKLQNPDVSSWAHNIRFGAVGFPSQAFKIISTKILTTGLSLSHSADQLKVVIDGDDVCEFEVEIEFVAADLLPDDFERVVLEVVI